MTTNKMYGISPPEVRNDADFSYSTSSDSGLVNPWYWQILFHYPWVGDALAEYNIRIMQTFYCQFRGSNVETPTA